MKKMVTLTLALVLVLGLTACGGEKDKTVWDTGDVQALLDSGAFSEELEELDKDTAFVLYKLADYGLDRLSGAIVHRSAGATCEELAYLVLDSKDSAETAEKALKDYVQSQIEENTDYRPAEIPKLENAYIARRGETLLLVVANDIEAAKKAVE